MSTTIILSYALIIVGVVVWVSLIPGRKQVSPRLMSGIDVFGGAFLFASCFINLVPHMFIGQPPYRFVTPYLHFKIAAAVMVGYLVQLMLERLTHGVEHGHAQSGGNSRQTIGALMIGLCIHAFLEGMPMVDLDGDIHQGLLYGIVLHNIPIALVLVALFIGNGYGFWRSLALLTLFAIMTPLGSVCGLYLIPENEVLQSLVMGVVVGILLHVSVSILFGNHNCFSWSKLLLIFLAFVAAYFTPGCPEIYGTI